MNMKIISYRRLDSETGYRKPVPGTQYPVSSIRHGESSIRQQAARNQMPVSSSQYPASNINHRASRIQLPAASNQQPPVSIQYPESSIQLPEAGFTLLEVLIAMAIMAIVLVSVYRLHSQTLSMTTANKFYTQAPLLAQSKMAQLEALSSDAISEDSGDFGDKFPGYGWSVSMEDVSSEMLDQAAEDLKRIDLTVTLNENEYEYTVRLYRMMSE